jgi:hypothetical protein
MPFPIPSDLCKEGLSNIQSAPITLLNGLIFEKKSLAGQWHM